MGLESDIAKEVAGNGLRMLKKVLKTLDGIPLEDWPKGYVRDISDCVMAAVRYQAEERAQVEFEKDSHLSPEEIRSYVKAYLAALPPIEALAFFAEVQGKGKEART